MRFVERALRASLVRAARAFSALLLTGPRRAGKTTLLRHTFPKASYHLLEDPDVLARVRADPRGFLDEVRLPAILDEVQNAPEILNYVRTRIDEAPSRKGRWFLTGSQESALMRGATESMAGRAAVFHLLPLSVRESAKVSVLRGGFPEVIARPSSALTWFRSYIQTYLERDVRSVSSIRDLATFRRFLALLATRTGQILNKTDLAAPLSVSVPTITEWLGILEVTGQIVLVPPFFENFGKRLIKSPKIYFVDPGLCCSLLGIESEQALKRSPFRGPLFEGFVVAEVVKQQVNQGREREVYYFRDQQGLEVDLIVPAGAGRLWVIEAKATGTPTPAAAAPLQRLAAAIENYQVVRALVFQPTRHPPPFRTLLPGVAAMSVQELLERLDATGRRSS